MRVLVCGTAPPAAALAGALQWAGHRVTLTSHGPSPSELEAAGVGWVPSDWYRRCERSQLRYPSAWETGVSSEIRSLPLGFSHRTLLRFGRGVTATVKEWGETVLRLKGTDRAQTQTDLATNYLSYWTDNGQTPRFENAVTFEKAALILLAGAACRGVLLRR